MKIKVDVREGELITILENKLTTNDVNFHQLIKEQLPIGDIIFCDNNDNELLLIERKSLNDLAASIKDGRYNEQSFRLDGHTLHNHNIIYLVEGDLYKYFDKGRISKKTLQSSMCSILYYKGFSLLRTMTIYETADFIITFADKLEKEGKSKKGYYTTKIIDDNTCHVNSNIITINTEVLVNNHENINHENNHENNQNNHENNDDEHIDVNDSNISVNGKRYSEVMKIKKEKSANINKENIGEIMLSCIPGVSVKTAIEVMKKYKNIPNLLKALNEDINCLNKIYIQNDKGLRKINKTSIENIKNFLHIHEKTDIN